MAAAKTTAQIPEFAQKFREQVVSGVQQSQQLSVEAVRAWANAASALPVRDVTSLPGVESVEAATNYTFDAAGDLLQAQRDFALQLANVFTPRESA